MRYYNRTLRYMPMSIFTQEDFNPSEKTLRFIRQFAYSYRVCKLNNQSCSYSLN